MKFIVEKEIFEKLPNACFGVVMAKGIDNNKTYPEIEQLLDESIAAAAQRFEGKKVKEEPDILPYRFPDSRFSYPLPADSLSDLQEDRSDFGFSF